MPGIPVIDPREPARTRARRRLTSIAHRAIAELIDDMIAAGEPLTVSVYDRRAKGRLVVRWQAFDGETWEPVPRKAPPVPPPGRKLGAREQKILKLCQASPLTSFALARRLGVPHNSYHRGLLTRLVAEGRLKRVTEGYVAG